MKQDLVEYWERSKLIKDTRLIRAFKKIPRENFILQEDLVKAYRDHPLAIGYGQTISQPTTVMLMTQALELKLGDKVLEVGTGSGYQAALISEMVGKNGKVYTTEIVDALAKFARENLKRLKVKNVEVFKADGSKGLKKYAPFDKIIVTAGCPEVPKPLIDQLKVGGILIAPVGDQFLQKMLKIKKLNNKELHTEDLGDFIFVPLTGEYGHKE